MSTDSSDDGAYFQWGATVAAIWLWVGFFGAKGLANWWGDQSLPGNGCSGAGPKLASLTRRGIIFASVHIWIYGVGIVMGFCLMMSGMFGVFGNVKDELRELCTKHEHDAQDLWNWTAIMALPQGTALLIGHCAFIYCRFWRGRTPGTPTSLIFCTIAQIVQISSVMIWFNKVKTQCDDWTSSEDLYTSAVFALVSCLLIILVMVLRAYIWLGFGSVTRAATWYFNVDYPADKPESTKSQPDLPEYTNQRWVFLVEQYRSLFYFTFLLLTFVGITITYLFIDIDYDNNPLVDTFGLANVCIFYDFPPSNYVLPWFYAASIPMFVAFLWGMYIRNRIEYRLGNMGENMWRWVQFTYGYSLLAAITFSIIFAVSPQDGLPNHLPDTIQIHTVPFMMLQIAVCLWEFNAIWWGVNFGWKKCGFSERTLKLSWVYAYVLVGLTAFKFLNDFNSITKPAPGAGEKAPGLMWKPTDEPMATFFGIVDKSWFALAAVLPIFTNVWLTFFYADKLPLFVIDLTMYNPQISNDNLRVYLEDGIFPPNPWINAGNPKEAACATATGVVAGGSKDELQELVTLSTPAGSKIRGGFM